MPSTPAYMMDTWAVQYSYGTTLASLAKGPNSNIKLGNLYGSQLLQDSSDPLFAGQTNNGASVSNDSTTADEAVYDDPLWTYDEYETYAEADTFTTADIDGLYNKGQGYVFEAQVQRPSTGSYGHSLKVDQRTLMICGYQIIDSAIGSS